MDKILERMNEMELSLKGDIQKTNTEIIDIKKILCSDNQQKYNELNGIVQKQQSTINFLQKEVNKKILYWWVLRMTQIIISCK